MTSTLYTVVSPTQFLGEASLYAGSNAISIVTAGTVSTTETTVVAYMPPSNPQLFKWDLNGNLTNDGQRAFTWDVENRLRSVESVSSVVKLRSEFVYDAQSRRIERRDLTGWTGAAYVITNATRFVWDGWLLLAEVVSHSSGSGQTFTNINVWGLDLSQTREGAGGIDGLLGRIERGTNYLYTFDGNGNVADVVDSFGAVVAHYELDPFGRTVSLTGPCADANPWRFSTKQIEPAWGLYYYGLRFLQVQTGRWLSPDPIGERGGLNLYGFVGNEPVGASDRLGLAIADEVIDGGTISQLTPASISRRWITVAAHAIRERV